MGRSDFFERETFVGADAHIGPAIPFVFTEIQCEFVGTQGAMWASPPTRMKRLKIYFYMGAMCCCVRFSLAEKIKY